MNSPRKPLLTLQERNVIELAWEWSTSRTKVQPGSIHGPIHWRRVARLGMRMARLEGADLLVVALFAGCHDVERVHDGKDMKHGPRAAARVQAELAPRLGLDAGQLDDLVLAIQSHTEGQVTDNATVGCCWDADRLDLVRIGFRVDPARLSTAAARTQEMQNAAARLWARDKRLRRRAGLPNPKLVPQPGS